MRVNRVSVLDLRLPADWQLLRGRIVDVHYRAPFDTRFLRLFSFYF